jgi:uncharacterized protein (DUF58 family)
MGFGPTERSKELMLIELATVLARLMTRGGNRVGAILYNNEVERLIRPRSGRNQVLHLTRELLRPAEPTGTATALRGLVEAAARAIKRRSVVVLVSDFISVPGWERPLSLLGEHHELVAIRLSDPREEELPDAGLIVVEDAETGELLSVDTSDPEFRQRFQAAARQRQAELEDAVRRAGVELYDVSTEDDLAHALVRIVEARRRRVR